MPTIISLALLIQILYYIIHDAHFIVILFIIMSLTLLKFSRSELVFLFIPMILSHAVYWFLVSCEYPSYEGFKKGRGGGGGKGGGGGGGGGGKGGGLKKVKSATKMAKKAAKSNNAGKWKMKHDIWKRHGKQCRQNIRSIRREIEIHNTLQ